MTLIVSILTVSCTKEVIKPITATEMSADSLKGPGPGLVCELTLADTVTVVDTMLVEVGLVSGPNTVTVSHKSSAPGSYILLDFGNYSAMGQAGVTVRIRRHLSNDIYWSHKPKGTNGFTANINYSTWSPSKYIVEVVTSSGMVLASGTMCK